MTNTPDVVAQRAGVRRPVLDKHASDGRPYLIDLGQLMRPGELIAEMPEASSDAESFGVLVSNPRIRSAGRMVEVHIDGGRVPAGRPWLDTELRVKARTTVGRIVAVITLRVHA